jgi:hypothetical protein
MRIFPGLNAVEFPHLRNPALHQEVIGHDPHFRLPEWGKPGGNGHR